MNPTPSEATVAPAAEPASSSKAAAPKAAAKPAVTLGKIGGNTATVELRVKLVGDAAAVFLDYQTAYQKTYGEGADKDALATGMVSAFIEADKGFQKWRKSNREAAS